MMKKLHYISKILFFSDKYKILKKIFKFIVTVFLGGVTSTLHILDLNTYVPYPRFLEFLLLTIIYYITIDIIINIDIFKKFIPIIFMVLCSIILVFILMFLLIFLMTYLFGYLGLASTYIYNQSQTLYYWTSVNHISELKYNEELKRLGIKDGTNISCVGPVNFDTILFAFGSNNNYTDSFKCNYYKNISLCFQRGFLSFVLLLILSSIVFTLILWIPNICKCLSLCKKEAINLTEEINIIDIKINN